MAREQAGSGDERDRETVTYPAAPRGRRSAVARIGSPRPVGCASAWCICLGGAGARHARDDRRASPSGACSRRWRRCSASSGALRDRGRASWWRCRSSSARSRASRSACSPTATAGGSSSRRFSSSWRCRWSWPALTDRFAVAAGRRRSSSGWPGRSFAIGVPFVARWFPPARQGMALGIYGMGNIGTAVAALVAPPMAGAFGWPFAFWVFVPVVLAMGVLVWLFGRDAPGPRPVVSLAARLAPLKQPDRLGVEPVLLPDLRRLRGDLRSICRRSSSTPSGSNGGTPPRARRASSSWRR